MMSISVVVPTYNCARYVGAAIESVLDQSVPVDELIIVDDCSCDGTLEVVNTYAKKEGIVRLFHMPINSGAGATRNKGVELASGEWILFLDGDDVAERYLLEAQLARFRELERAKSDRWVLAHSSYVVINEAGEQQPGVHRWRQVRPEETLGYQFLRNHVSTSGVLVRHVELCEAGGFDEGLRVSEDADLWLKLAARGGFAYVDDPLVRVRRHDNNTSSVLSNMLRAEKEVVSRYSLPYIKDAIHRRSLSWEENETDFVSMLFRLDLWQQGYEVLSGLLDQKWGTPKVHFLMALYFLHHHAWDAAETQLRLCLNLAPNHGAALNNLAVVLAMSRRQAEARKLLSRALDVLPEYLDASQNLSLLSDSGDAPAGEFRITWRELRPTLLPYAR